MTGPSPKIEVLDGLQRLRWTAAEKLAIRAGDLRAGCHGQPGRPPTWGGSQPAVSLAQACYPSSADGHQFPGGGRRFRVPRPAFDLVLSARLPIRKDLRHFRYE